MGFGVLDGSHHGHRDYRSEQGYGCACVEGAVVALDELGGEGGVERGCAPRRGDEGAHDGDSEGAARALRRADFQIVP